MRESELGAHGPNSTGGSERMKKKMKKGERTPQETWSEGDKRTMGCRRERERRVLVTHYRVKGGERGWGGRCHRGARIQENRLFLITAAPCEEPGDGSILQHPGSWRSRPPTGGHILEQTLHTR